MAASRVGISTRYWCFAPQLTPPQDIPAHGSSSQQRQPLGLVVSSLPSRQSYLRTHSQSVSNSSAISSSRINRRKSSVQVSPANAAALAAAVKEILPYGAIDVSRGQLDGSIIPQSPRDQVLSASVSNNTSAIVDGPSLSTMLSSGKSKSRARRASEGSRVSKERSKSSAGELRCETCGKGYKHGSCLSKHLWEHTPEWSLTSKLLISKHQQVQLLEAASVLVQMNQNTKSTALLTISHDDENSSASPAASGSSGPIDEDDASSRTSTPSQDESSKTTRYSRRSRVDSFSDVFARSYQSSSIFGTSIPESHAVPMYRQWSSNGAEHSDEEQFEVKKGNYGSVSDIPPVPPLPAKYAKIDPLVDIEMINGDEDDGVFGDMEQ